MIFSGIGNYSKALAFAGVLTCLGGVGAVQAMPVQSTPSVASTNLVTPVQYRDWDRERWERRRWERHREYRRWQRERDGDRWERHRRWREWERRNSY